MDWLTIPNMSDLFVLCLMEIVLGIDNIVFIAIVTSRLPKEVRSRARKIGLMLALVMRIILLSSIYFVAQFDDPLFTLTGMGIPESWLSGEHIEEINGISIRDLVLLIGGLFLIGKSVLEIHEQFNASHHDEVNKKEATFVSVLIQIAILDIVFSLDSVIAAIGLAEAQWVMITAIIIAVGAMIMFANAISDFVEANPTLKMLALSFLIMIGVMLVIEGTGAHIDKGYIYFAMAFSLVVEFMNINLRSRSEKNANKNPSEITKSDQEKVEEAIPPQNDSGDAKPASD